MTMSSAPVTVNPDRQRARKTPASRLMPMAVSSVPVRNHHRIGLGRASLMKAGAPYRSADLPGGFQTIRLRRCDRILITAPYTSGRPREAHGSACTQIVRSPLFGDTPGVRLITPRLCREDTSQVRLSHTLAQTSAVFDDPNLVSYGGLVPVVALAERAGLPEL